MKGCGCIAVYFHSIPPSFCKAYTSKVVLVTIPLIKSARILAQTTPKVYLCIVERETIDQQQRG